MLTLAGSSIFLLRNASAIALAKEADQPAANNCSGLVPMRAEPGLESLMSSKPSELRAAPLSRPPEVSVLAVYTTFVIRFMVRLFEIIVPARGKRRAPHARAVLSQANLRSERKPARS